MSGAVEGAERLPRFRPYPGYKDSGSELIGRIPTGWRRARIKDLADHSIYYPLGDGDHGAIKPDFYCEEGVPYIRVQNLDWGFELRFEGMVFIPDHVHRANPKSHLRPGDILVAKTGATVGKTAIIPDDVPEANTTSSVGKLTVDGNRVHARFCAYCIRSKLLQDQIWAVASQKSAQPGFDIEDFAVFDTPLPPVHEQRAIAEFLDRETGKIDRLVAKKDRLIELLQEKRAALITHAVTKGLAPTVPTKPSGIDWLGDIPAHWEVTRLSYLSERIGDGIHTTPIYVDESPYYFINGNNLIDGQIAIKPSTKCVSFEEFRKHDLRLNSKTLLLSINGTIGNLAYFRGEKVVLGKSAAYIVLGNKIIEQFAFKVLQSSVVRRYFEEGMAGTTISNLSLKSIRDTPIAIPPLAEQRQISELLERECSELGKLIEKSNEAIVRLREFRSALISAAVTGKIDVRAEVA